MSNLVPVAAGILMNSRYEVLMAKVAAHRKYAYKWEFPGGKLEGSENWLDALLREMAEELGIIIHFPKFVLECINPHGWEIRFYLITRWTGFPALKDHLALAWVPLTAVHTYDLVNENEMEVTWKLLDMKDKGELVV